MLSDTQVQQFGRDGFIQGPQVLDGAEIDSLIDEVMRVIAQRDRADVTQPVMIRNMSGDDSPVWEIVNIWQASEPFARLLERAALVESAARLMQAEELRIWHDQIQYKPPQKGGTTGWHQDSPAWPPLAPKTEQITAWIALDDADEDNGAMSMVPGSHRWGVQSKHLHRLGKISEMPRQFDGREIEVRLCPVARGHVHFHHGLTWHGSHDNHSGRHRRAVAMHFMTDRTVFDAEGGNHVMRPFIEVDDGEKVEGGPFRLVWQGGEVVSGAAAR